MDKELVREVILKKVKRNILGKDKPKSKQELDRIKSEIAAKRKSIKKHFVLYRYLTTEFDRNYPEEPDNELFQYLNNILKKQLYTQDPFFITAWDLLYLCDEEKYKKWIEEKKLLIKYCLSTTLSLSSKELKYIEKHRRELV
ncbi:TPA: hypothetical protein J1W26_004572 [Escherichia coli]|nr:hypothetical protein [Escherichia coli]HBA6900549.1 hypothetical protein [Escherichia coli]